MKWQDAIISIVGFSFSITLLPQLHDCIFNIGSVNIFTCVKDGVVEYHYLYCADLLEAVKKHEMIYGWGYKVLRVDVNETTKPDVVQSKIGDYITL